MARLFPFLVFVFLPSVLRGSSDPTAVMIEGRVNGRVVRLGFDTGAGVGVALWQKAADDLGVRYQFPEGAQLSNPTQVVPGASEPLLLELLGNRFEGVQLPVVRLPLHLSRDFEGLIGWGAVRDNLLLFDLAKDGPRTLPHLPSECAGWLTFSLLRDSPTLAFEVPGLGIVGVDTGSEDALHLSHAKWLEWRQAHPEPAPTVEDYFMLGSGTVVREVMYAPSYQVGELKLRHLLVQEASPTDAMDFGERYAGTLGRAALRQLVVVIDGKNGKIYFKPGTGPVLLSNYNRLGAVFAPRDEGEVLYGTVLPESPAARAGFQNGDVLVKIDEVDVTKWRQVSGIFPLRQFFQKPAGTKVRIEVLREGRPFAAEVVLQEFFPAQEEAPHRP